MDQAWAQTPSALVYILSDTLPATDKAGEPAPSRTHSFDSGAAWMAFALQATRMGYQAHGMSGVDFERAREELGVPERYRIEAAAAVGRIGDPATLSEKLRAREVPSGRKPVEDFVSRAGGLIRSPSAGWARGENAALHTRDEAFAGRRV